MVRTKKAKILAIICTLGMLATMFIVPFTASAASVGVSYSGYQAKSWNTAADGYAIGHANMGLSIEALKVDLTGTVPDTASISYSIYENKGWHSAADGGAVGNANKKLSAEALEVSLNNMPGYSVTYSVYENKAWHTASDGAAAGNANKGYKIEAVRISIVPVVVPTTAAAISPVTSPIAVGGQTGFTFKDATGAAVTVDPSTVTWAVADPTCGSISASGIFTAAKSGPASITATIGTTVLSTTVNVYSGTVSTVKIGAPTTIIANGASYNAVTLSAVDASGFVVGSFEGTFTISSTGSDGYVYNDASGDSKISSVTAVNGVATVYVKSGTIAGTSITFNVTGVSAITSGFTTVTATFAQIAQVATSIKVTADKVNFPVNIAYNNIGNDDFTVKVLDQTGNQMINGTYTLTATLSGANAAFDTSSTITKTLVLYYGEESTTVGIYVPQANVGTVTLNVTGASLAAGSAFAPSVVTGTASKIVLATDSSSSSSFAVDSTSGTIVDVNQYDANNNYVGANSASTSGLIVGNTNAKVTIDDASGNDVTSKFSITNAASKITIIDGNSSSYAGIGVYTVSVVGSYFTTAVTSTFTVTAGAAYKLNQTVAPVITGTGATVSTVVTLQVVDKAGDSVAAPTGASVSEAATLSGKTATLSSSTPTFDSTGKATVTVTVPNYDGDVWSVVATPSGLTVTSAITASVLISDHPVASIAFTLYDTSSSGSTTDLIAGDNLVLSSLTLEDASALPVSATVAADETFNVVVSHASGLSGLTGGTANTAADTYTISSTTSGALAIDFANVTGAKAGAVNIAITDAITGATKSVSITVDPDQAMKNGHSVSISQLSNNMALTHSTASTAITINLVDVGGNTIVATTGVAVTLTDTLVSGNATLQDANHVSASTGLTIAVGTSSISGYLQMGSATGTDVLTFTPSGSKESPLSVTGVIVS